MHGRVVLHILLVREMWSSNKEMNVHRCQCNCAKWCARGSWKVLVDVFRVGNTFLDVMLRMPLGDTHCTYFPKRII